MVKIKISKKEEKDELKKKKRFLERKERDFEFQKTFNATIIGALTFVAGLFWRDVINDFLDFFPELPGLIGKIISTVMITLIFVIVITKMNTKTTKLDRKLDRERKRLEEKEEGIK